MTGSAQAALIAGIARLKEAGIEGAAADARLLLAHALGIAPTRLSMVVRDPLPEAATAVFDAAISARLSRRPVSQIIGERLFWGRKFKVTSDTLDPRPETEILVAEALKVPARRLLDLGTGTGCILLSCLADLPEAEGIGIDASEAALAVSRDNAEALGLGGRATFRRGNWLEAGWTERLGQFDLILSNPPYIAAEEMPALAPEVLDWEPHEALSPGGDGLSAYRAIAAAAPKLLAPKGRILFEIGPTQGEAVSSYLAAAGLRAMRILKDLDQRDRVVMAEAA